MRGAIHSLNAAVAGSILVFEAVSQRDPEGRGERDSATTGTPRPVSPAAALLADEGGEGSAEPADQDAGDAAEANESPPPGVPDEPESIESPPAEDGLLPGEPERDRA
jgi:hypothetical protein